MGQYGVENLPWWLILIIIVGILIVLGLIIPLIRYLIGKKHEREDNKIAPVERKVAQSNVPVKDPKNTPYMGFNWFGKKQAIRTVKTVYVQEVEDPCPLCAVFENQVLSLEEYGQNVTLMSEAISVGYHHLGCKHIDLDYFHETTQIPEKRWTKEHKQTRYNLRLEQYKFEERIRQFKYKIDNEAKTKAEQTKLINRLKFEEEKLTEFCQKNGLERNQVRENYLVSELKKFS